LAPRKTSEAGAQHDRKEEEAEFFHIADGDMRAWEDWGQMKIITAK